MKKTMILALAVLGMVLGTLLTTQAKADCDGFDDPYGCYVAVCSSCIFWTCVDQDPDLTNSACVE